MAEPSAQRRADKFSQSGPFRALLAEVYVDVDRTIYDDPVLIHEPCAEVICSVEDADTMDVLVETVIQHDCPAQSEHDE